MRPSHWIPALFAALVALVAWSVGACRETVAHFEKDGTKVVFDLSSKK